MQLNERTQWVNPGSRRFFRFCWWLTGVGAISLGSLLLSAQSPSRSLDSLLQQGGAALDAGDFTTAAGKFEEARQLAPENKMVWRGLLLSYLRGKQTARAVAVGQEAVGMTRSAVATASRATFLAIMAIFASVFAITTIQIYGSMQPWFMDKPASHQYMPPDRIIEGKPNSR